MVTISEFEVMFPIPYIQLNKKEINLTMFFPEVYVSYDESGCLSSRQMASDEESIRDV